MGTVIKHFQIAPKVTGFYSIVFGWQIQDPKLKPCSSLFFLFFSAKLPKKLTIQKLLTKNW